MKELEIIKVTKEETTTEKQNEDFLANINNSQENAGCHPVKSCGPHDYCCPDSGWR